MNIAATQSCNSSQIEVAMNEAFSYQGIVSDLIGIRSVRLGQFTNIKNLVHACVFLNFRDLAQKSSPFCARSIIRQRF